MQLQNNASICCKLKLTWTLPQQHLEKTSGKSERHLQRVIFVFIRTLFWHCEDFSLKLGHWLPVIVIPLLCKSEIRLTFNDIPYGQKNWLYCWLRCFYLCEEKPKVVTYTKVSLSTRFVKLPCYVR